ncbi:hypothetical protein BKA70DRAFT_1237500 [Coprinopsis sp. MPI-PUGE-AT-0042]|nr:hypothetical protein BKA70DRAFT_1237500 [Coprinopsis sp. MPI-PUGE-AT-0042]
MSSELDTPPQLSNVTSPLEAVLKAEIQGLKAKVEELGCQLYAAKMEVIKTKAIIEKEKDKIIALNAEVLRAKLAIDCEMEVKISDRVSQLNNQLDEMERERDLHEHTADLFKRRLNKSKEMNLALINFIAAVLGDGIYPECQWEQLKLQQGS